MRAAATASAALMISLAGCAHDRVTLLDNEEGATQFAVADISDPARERVVDGELSELKLGSRAAPRKLTKIRERDASLARGLPPPVKTFTITFPLGQSRIPVDQRGTLEQIRNELSTRPGAQIEVAGFTDSTGGATINDAISVQRAQAVAAELREFGFPVATDDAVGRGMDEAVKKLGAGVASEAYRRVDIIVR